MKSNIALLMTVLKANTVSKDRNNNCEDSIYLYISVVINHCGSDVSKQNKGVNIKDIHTYKQEYVSQMSMIYCDIT